jgi:hypothetical protein
MAARVNVLMKVEGGDALRRALQKKAAEVAREMELALPQEGEALRRQGDATVPRATGELAASSSVTSAVLKRGTRVKVAVAYLDEKAAAVHEGVHFGRKVKGTRGFKWLERAMQRFEAGFVERIVARLRRLVGG